MSSGPIGWLKAVARPVIQAAERLPAWSDLEVRLLAQQGELERLKWRQTRLQSTLRYALAGFPARDPATTRYLEELPDLAPPTLDPMQDAWALLGVEDVAELHRERLAALCGSALSGLRPRSALVADGESAGAVTGVLRAFPGLEAVTVVDPGERLGDVFGPRAERLAARDAAAAVAGLTGRSFDLIVCCHTFERLAPWAQQGFVARACERLAPGGALLLTALDPQAAPDAYWANPLNLRPYSRARLREELARAGGRCGRWDELGAASPRDGTSQAAELVGLVRRASA